MVYATFRGHVRDHVPVAGVPVLQWRTLEEVEPGTRVAIRRAADSGSFDPSEEQNRWMTLAGALVSEGWASTSRAGFNNTDEQGIASYLLNPELGEYTTKVTIYSPSGDRVTFQ